ncbi:MAG: hypothetical protein SGJ23_07385 [Alphaproteobacteria bacterium]|nr:hypothetical protein [Alphaproteobacteria bacterium]
MAQRSKVSVDMQFLFGDTLIKTGVAVMWLCIVIGIYTPFSLNDALAQNMVGYLSMIAGLLLLAFGLWQWGRKMREQATIADR